MNRFEIALGKDPPPPEPKSKKLGSGVGSFSPVKVGDILVVLPDGTLGRQKDYPGDAFGFVVAGSALGVSDGVVTVQISNGMIVNMAYGKSGLSNDNVEFIPTPLPSHVPSEILMTRHIRYG